MHRFAAFFFRHRRVLCTAGAVAALILVCALLVGRIFSAAVETAGPPPSSPAPSAESALPEPVPVSEPSELSSEEAVSSDPEPAETLPALPADVRGVWLRPGTDFPAGSGDGFEAVLNRWDELLRDLKTHHLNTVFLSVQSGDKTLYPGERYIFESQERNLLTELIAAAKDHGLFVYCVYEPGENADQDVLTVRTLKALRALAETEPDGIFLERTRIYPSAARYAAYMTHGGGLGFDAFLREQTNYFVRVASETVKALRPKMLFGTVADPVWATDAVRPDGLKVRTDYTAYGDRRADVKAWLQKGLLDCVLVVNDTALQNSSVPFGTVAEWWQKTAAETGRPALFLLSSQKAADRKFGASELTNQFKFIKQKNGPGAVFDSFSSLKYDQTGSTSALMSYFDATVGNRGTAGDLKITAPAKLSFTTSDETVTFRGTSDPAAPLTLNGRDVSRSASGAFSEERTLKPGLNRFVFHHKDRVVTYLVTYKLRIIDDYFPAVNQTLSGGAVFQVSVTALPGSTVKASLGGVTVTLKPDAADTRQETSGGSKARYYVVYSGSFKIPAAKSKVQDLGRVTFRAAHSGQTDVRTGGRVKVKAKAVPKFDPKDKYANVEPGTVAEVIVDQAETFRGDTNDDYSNPLNNYLPKGTVDYVDPTPVNGPAGTYHLWRYGNRTYLSSSSTGTNIKMYKGTLPETNTVTVHLLRTEGRHTVLALDTRWKAPFRVTYDQTEQFENPAPKTGAPSFALKGDFRSTYVDITFCYAAMGQGVVEFPEDHPVFASARWIKGARDYTLRLTFKKPGGFYGWGAEYDADGRLVFRFLHPARLSENPEKPLEGIKIVLDPGHGGKDPGALGFNDNFPEKTVALSLAKKIQSELTAMGAEVTLTRTTDVYLRLYDRAVMTRDIKPDLFVSVHLNASASSSAKGYENYYFTPYSRRAAAAVEKKASGAYSKTRGDLWYPFFVTRVTECPSILTENGFMSNRAEFEWMLKSENQTKVAKRTAEGILDYFKSIQ